MWTFIALEVLQSPVILYFVNMDENYFYCIIELYRVIIYNLLFKKLLKSKLQNLPASDTSTEEFSGKSLKADENNFKTKQLSISYII